MISRSNDNPSGLTPEQLVAFRDLNFNGLSVEKVIQEGDKCLPYNLDKNPEVAAVFRDVRARYKEWSFLCEKDSLFNEPTANLLLELGVLTPDFFTVLFRALRLEKYRRHLKSFLQSIARGEYLAEYFDQEIEVDPDCHRTFIREILPRVLDVFSAYKKGVRLDIESNVGKTRLLDDILTLLSNEDALKVFTAWKETDAKRVRGVLERVRQGLTDGAKEGFMLKLAMENMKLREVKGASDEHEAFLDSIDRQFDSLEADEEDETPKYEAGHGWEDQDEGGLPN